MSGTMDCEKKSQTRLPGAVPHQIELFFIEFDLDWIDFGFIEFGCLGFFREKKFGQKIVRVVIFFG